MPQRELGVTLVDACAVHKDGAALLQKKVEQMDNNSIVWRVSGQGQPAWTRRQFLKGSTTATVGLAGILVAKTSPVYAAKRIVTRLVILTRVAVGNTE